MKGTGGKGEKNADGDRMAYIGSPEGTFIQPGEPLIFQIDKLTCQ
jgi:hypothetical protein